MSLFLQIASADICPLRSACNSFASSSTMMLFSTALGTAAAPPRKRRKFTDTAEGDVCIAEVCIAEVCIADVRLAASKSEIGALLPRIM